MSIYSFRPPAGESPGFSALFRQLLDDVRDLFRQHIELTKTEIRIESRRASKAIAFSIAGLLLTQVTLIYLGSLLMLSLLALTPLRIVGATLTVFLILLVLVGICAGLVYSEVRKIRADLKPGSRD